MPDNRTQTDYKEFAKMDPPEEDSLNDNLNTYSYAKKTRLSSRLKQLAIVNGTFLVTIEIARLLPFMTGYLPVFHLGSLNLPQPPAFLAPVWHILFTMWNALTWSLSWLRFLSMPSKLVQWFTFYTMEIIYSLSVGLLPFYISALSLVLCVIACVSEIVIFSINRHVKRHVKSQASLQPKINQLKIKYSEDREKLAQEQMKLYQEAGINPLSGCLPTLITL